MLRRGRVDTAMRLFLLSLLVVQKVIEDGRRMSEGVQDLENSFTFLNGHFLRVARVSHRFVLVVFESNMSQLGIRHIFYVDPFY